MIDFSEIPNYQQIWKTISMTYASRDASKLMVGILHLAATTNKEQEISERVLYLLSSDQKLTLMDLQHEFCTRHGEEHWAVTSHQHALSEYNQFISSSVEVSHASH